MRKTALITGASAGIGVELARIFARERNDVILAARREDRLPSAQRARQAASLRCPAVAATARRFDDQAVTGLHFQVSDGMSPIAGSA